MKHSNYWAVKYLDKNGYFLSTGYAYALDTHKPGEITELWNGQRVLWEFELSNKSLLFDAAAVI